MPARDYRSEPVRAASPRRSPSSTRRGSTKGVALVPNMGRVWVTVSVSSYLPLKNAGLQNGLGPDGQESAWQWVGTAAAEKLSIEREHCSQNVQTVRFG